MPEGGGCLLGRASRSHSSNEVRDIRAVLLSQGVSDVQFQHYDRHSYEPEMRAALERWEQHLDDLLHPKPDRKVVPMRRRKVTPRA